MSNSTKPTSAGTDETAISVQGMNCASCVAHVEKALREVEGVTEASVNLSRGRAVVRYDSAATHPTQLAEAVSRAGYPSEPELPETSPANAEQQRLERQANHARKWKYRAILGLALWLPLETLHFVAMQTSLLPGHGPWLNWVLFGGSTLAMIAICGAFYQSAFGALRRGTSNMDTLISMGASVAYFYSSVLFIGSLMGRWTLHDRHLYFTEAIGLLALISLGHWLEARARTMAGSAIRQLLELTPSKALRLDASETPQKVDVEDLKVGDQVLIRPGDRVPVDGVVVRGRSNVNEAMLTGEPIPAVRDVGDEVVGGTHNLDGRLIVRATKIGSDSALAQIVKMVETAQSSKPPVQKLADRIAAIFVPAVLVIALITGIGWAIYGQQMGYGWAETSSRIALAVCSVLIIACPCALGLAVPAALMVGIGRGARRGILIRDIDGLQNAEKVKTIVLDKTGTITRGKPTVTRIIPLDGSTRENVLRIAAVAEQSSEHPLARAILQAAKALGHVPEPEAFNNEPGLGVTARIKGIDYLVGNDELLRKHGQLTSGYPPQQDAPRTIVHVGRKDGAQVHRVGLLIISDEMKADSTDAIATLKRMRMQTVLLTGDNSATATAVARQAGIDTVFADVRPGAKADKIRELQAQGGRVAMVGDGINDAPALAVADLGIAIGSGSDIAKETGDIVLVSGSLSGIATAIRLSQATMRKIRQNLFFAFIYNVIAIPLAAFGLLNPLIAAAAMALSDVTVIGNSLLLRRTRIDEKGVNVPKVPATPEPKGAA